MHVQRHHALGVDFDRRPIRAAQTHAPAQRARAQVELAFEGEHLGCVRVQALLAQPDFDALAVGDRHPGVGAQGEAAEALVVVDRVLFVDRGQIAAVAIAAAFLEAAAHAQRAVGEREQGRVALPALRFVTVLAQAPAAVGVELVVEENGGIRIGHASLACLLDRRSAAGGGR